MEKEDKIKAIIFDIGGVVYISKEPEYVFMQRALKLSNTKYEKVLRRYIKKTSKGALSQEKALGKISKSTGLSVKEIKKAYIKNYKKFFKLNKKLLKIIKKLKINYNVSILSNQFSLSYGILVNKKLLKHFHISIFSHKVKARKPNLKIYKIILKKLKLLPQEVIFIDDLERNLKPAKKLGMKTIIFKNNKQLVRDLRKFGVKV